MLFKLQIVGLILGIGLTLYSLRKVYSFNRGVNILRKPEYTELTTLTDTMVLMKKRRRIYFLLLLLGLTLIYLFYEVIYQII